MDENSILKRSDKKSMKGRDALPAIFETIAGYYKSFLAN